MLTVWRVVIGNGVLFVKSVPVIFITEWLPDRSLQLGLDAATLAMRTVIYKLTCYRLSHVTGLSNPKANLSPVDLMLTCLLQRWTKIKAALYQYLVFWVAIIRRVLVAQFSLHVHTGGPKSQSFHFAHSWFKFKGVVNCARTSGQIFTQKAPR